MSASDGNVRPGLLLAILLVFVAAVIIGLRLGSGPADPNLNEPPDSTGGEVAPIATVEAPNVRFEPAFLDFGEVPPSTVLPETVEIINEGEQSVTLASLIASCGCLIAETDESVIEPGGRITMRVRYQTGDRQDQQVSYTITAMFEHHMNGIQLPVRSNTIHLYNVAAGDEPNRVTVTSVDGTPVTVVEHPAFVERVITPSAPRDTVILLTRQGAADDDRVRPARLELKHPRFGSVVIDWPMPEPGEWPIAPRPPEPQVLPDPLELELPPAVEGEPVMISLVLRGLRAGQVSRLEAVSDGPRPFVAEIIEHEAVAEGVRLSIRLMFDHRARRAGSILFRFDGEPLCRVRLKSATNGESP